jgi:hypothetical protein
LFLHKKSRPAVAVSKNGSIIPMLIKLIKKLSCVCLNGPEKVKKKANTDSKTCMKTI